MEYVEIFNKISEYGECWYTAGCAQDEAVRQAAAEDGMKLYKELLDLVFKLKPVVTTEEAD